MADNQYLSIGEVLGLLLEDFPDVTISKIRFLESQGLIEPERTPSGYRKFYDNDVELLRAILHEQKANFLPLKVIRDRIEAGALEGDNTGGRTPPRGIRNVESRTANEARSAQAQATERPNGHDQHEAAVRDSVFRRTDGGPEWAGGRALIPGVTTIDSDARAAAAPPSPITTAVPVIPPAPEQMPPPRSAKVGPAPMTSIAETKLTDPPKPPVARAPAATIPTAAQGAPKPAAGPKAGAPKPKPAPGRSGSPVRGLPYNRDELCSAAGVTPAQLAELEDFGILASRGTGVDTSFQQESVEIARIAGLLLARGIDARHLRAWRQAAERESDLFEQRIMPLLRQRNPQARQLALDSLAELSGLGSQLHTALVESMLQHHFDGT